VYELKANVGYVRARVKDSGGAMAWVQPVFTFTKERPSYKSSLVGFDIRKQ
jgi:hypothetical protein